MCGQSLITMQNQPVHYRQTIVKRKLKAVAKDLNKSFLKVAKTNQLGMDIRVDQK